MSLSSLSLTSSDDEEAIPKRVFKDRMNPFYFYTDEEFKKQYRLSKTVVKSLQDTIGAKLQHWTLRNKPVSALEQILLCINYYATGAYQETVADHVRVHKSTACRIVKKVSLALAKLRPRFIKMPITMEERDKIKRGFYAISAFPNVIGAVGCTHIKIPSPGGKSAQLFSNRNGYFSLNIQVVCDSSLRILDIISRWPGSADETTIFNNSHLRADFESGVYENDVLLGDSSYPCMSYLLTPFSQPQDKVQEAYNTAHIATRSTVEKCIGMLKSRFPYLSMGLRVKLDTAMNIIVACAVLHNIALANNEIIEPNLQTPEIEQDISIRAGNITDENNSVRTALLLTHFT